MLFLLLRGSREDRGPRGGCVRRYLGWVMLGGRVRRYLGWVMLRGCVTGHLRWLVLGGCVRRHLGRVFLGVRVECERGAGTPLSAGLGCALRCTPHHPGESCLLGQGDTGADGERGRGRLLVSRRGRTQTQSGPQGHAKVSRKQQGSPCCHDELLPQCHAGRPKSGQIKRLYGGRRCLLWRTGWLLHAKLLGEKRR